MFPLQPLYQMMADETCCARYEYDHFGMLMDRYEDIQDTPITDFFQSGYEGIFDFLCAKVSCNTPSKAILLNAIGRGQLVAGCYLCVSSQSNCTCYGAPAATFEYYPGICNVINNCSWITPENR